MDCYQLVLNLISDALKVNASYIESYERIDSIKEWDSLGMLNVLVRLDNEFSNNVSSNESILESVLVRDFIDIVCRNIK